MKLWQGEKLQGYNADEMGLEEFHMKRHQLGECHCNRLLISANHKNKGKENDRRVLTEPIVWE